MLAGRGVLRPYRHATVPQDQVQYLALLLLLVADLAQEMSRQETAEPAVLAAVVVVDTAGIQQEALEIRHQ